MSVQSSKLLELTLKAVEDKKAMNVVALDLRNVSPISDYFVICHGNSDTTGASDCHRSTQGCS